MHRLVANSAHTRAAMLGGLIIALGSLGTAIIVINVYSDTQARTMIEAMAPSTRTLCFASITASSTIIPLMLTILSFAQRLEREFDELFYRQIKLTARLSSAALVLSVTVLMILTVPLLESEALRSWFQTIYYVLVAGVSSIAGLVVTVVLILYRSLSDIILIVKPEDT